METHSKNMQQLLLGGPLSENKKTVKMSYEVVENKENSSLNVNGLQKTYEIQQTELKSNTEIRPVTILEKPRVNEKELFEMVSTPNVDIVESDEKRLFDISVQLKFGDRSVVVAILTDVLPQVFKDYPIECFRQKHEIIEELTNISKTKQDDFDLQYYSLWCQIRFVRSVKETVKNLRKQEFTNYNSTKAANNCLSDESEHIRLSYPSLQNARVAGQDPEKQQLEQADLRKRINNQLHWTIFQIVNHIAESTFEIIHHQDSINLGIVCLLWKKLIKLMRLVKPDCYEAVKCFVLKYIKMFNLFFSDNEKVIYDDLLKISIVLIARDLFCILGCADYEAEAQDKAHLEVFYRYISNPRLRCIYAKQQFDEVMEYLYVFGDKIKESSQKVPPPSSALRKLPPRTL